MLDKNKINRNCVLLFCQSNKSVEVLDYYTSYELCRLKKHMLFWVDWLFIYLYL